MAFIYYLCVSLPAILLTIAYYHVRSRSAAFVFTVSVRLLFARYLKSFSVNRIAIFPLVIDGLQVTTKGSRRHPETSISWTSVKVVFDYGGMWKNNSLSSDTAPATTEAPKIVSGSTKFITITVEELTISSQNLKFMDVLNPSPRTFTFPTSPNEGMGAGDSVESWRGTMLKRFLATPLLFFKFLATVCLQSFSSLFLIQVDKLTVDLNLPSHESSINITALQCLLYANSSSELKKADNSTSSRVRRQTSLDGLGVLFVMDMTEGRLILTQSGEVAFDYSGYFYRLLVDVHVPSRHMAISFRSINSPIAPSAESNESCDVNNRLKSLGLRDTVDVRIQALLEFYSRFQSAEDDAIELKLAKGLSASGRMRTISLGVDLLKVCVTDCRTPNPKNVFVDNVFFGIRNFKVDGGTGLRIGGDDWCGGIGIFSELFNTQESNLHQKISANIDKELMISADRIEWVSDLAPVSPYGSQDGGRRRFSSDINNRKSRSTREVAVFEGVKALKAMRVINEGDYTDIETLTGTLKSVQLENLSPCTLDWQLITQAVSESFPTGRFSHAKHSSLVVCVDNARFSMELGDLLEGSTSSCSSSGRHGSSIQRNDSNGYRNDSRTGHVSAKACSREIDRVVSFWFTGLSGKKDTVANQSTSKYSAHSELLEVCTTLLATSLRAEYNIKVGSVEDHFARSTDTSTTATGECSSTHRGEGGTDRDSHPGVRDSRNHSIDSLHLNRTGHMCGTSTGTSTCTGTNNKVKVNIDTSLEAEGSERVGVLYTFTPFEFSAQSLGPGKIQIETVKSNRLAIDLLFSIPLPTSATSKIDESAASNGCGGLHGMARSEFLRSTLDSSWKPTTGQSSGSDVICDLGDTLVYLSAAGALKLSLANQMVRTSIEGLTAAMSRIKSMPSRMLSRGVMRDDQSFSHTSLSDFRNSRIRLHREKDKEKEREKEKERDKTSDIAASNSLLTVRCSRLLISLLIAESTVLPNATSADYISPVPSSPAPTPAPHPQVSPSSDSPQPGTSASSDLDIDLENDLSDGKRAHTGQGQGQGQSKGQGQGGSRNDSQDLTLTMDYTVFEYQSSPLETRYSWDLGSAVVNDFSEKVFMTSSGFVYHTRRPPVGVPYSYSSSATDSPTPPLDSDEKVVFGQNHEREGDGIGVEIPGVRYTTVHMAELEIGMSPHMQLGLTIDHLFAQHEAYKIAKEAPVHRVRMNTSPSPPPTMDCVEDIGEQGKEREMSFTYNAYTDAFEFEDLDCPDVDGVDAPPDPYKYDTPIVPRTDQEKIIDEQNSRMPSVLVVSMGMYRYTLDAVHKNIHIPGFAVLECTNLKVKIDATKDEAAVCDEISTLDFGPENPPDPIPGNGGFKSSNASINKSGKKTRRVGEKKSDKRKKASNSMNRNCLQYKRSGGIVTVSQDRMVMRFVCQKEAYMDTTRWRMTGPIYVASAVTLDGAIPTQKEDIILADTAYLPCLLLNPVAHTEAYPRMASLHTHNDLFDTPEYVSMSPGLSPSPRRETSDSRGGFCYFDISSTDGSYGSALRPFDSPKRSHVASKLDTAGTRIPCRRTVCSASLVRSAAPQKIYWDAAASAATLDMWFEDSTKEFMDSFNVSLAPCLTPVREPAPSLAPWDSMLYWFHGFLTCSVDEVVVTNLVLDSTAKSVLLQTKLEEVTWHISETTFEFCARAVEVGLITQKGGKKYNSNSRRRSSMTAASLFAPQCRPSLKRTFSRSEGRLFETARLLYVPGIVMAVSHSVFDAATAYSHHDVYLYPAREGGGGLGRCVDDDKYAYLRSRKMSSKANFELRILDSSTEPLTVNARLDVLHGLLEAVNQAAQQKTDPEFDSPCVSRPGSPHYRPDFPTLTPLTPSKTPLNPGPGLGPTPLTAPPSGLMSKVRRSGLHDYPALEVKEKCPLTIFSIMRQWDVQIALGRIVVCSWPSRNALSGVVLTLAGLDLQLRLLREVPLDYRSSAPFFTPMSPSSLSPPSELSLSPVSSAPFAYNLSSTSEEADRQHRPSLSPINEDIEFMGSPETVKAQKKDKLNNFVTFSENTRGGLELRGDSDEELKYPTASRKNGRKPLVLSPAKQQQREKDKDTVKVKPIRTSSLSNESEVSSCKDSTEDTARSTTEDEDFPMQVEHLFTEIHFADIYARDWSVTSRTQSGMKAQSERRDSLKSTERSSFSTTNLPDSLPGSGKGGERDGRGSEPANVTDLQRLFRPLCRLAHASRVVVSLTEDGEVAGKLDTFETVGLLPVSQQRSQQQTQGAQMSQEMRVAGANAHKEIGLSPRLHLYIGKERRKSSLDNTDATRIKYLQSRFSASPVQRRVCSRPSIDAGRDLTKGGEREDGVKKCPLTLVDPASIPPSLSLSLSPSIGTRNQNGAGSSVPSSSYSPLGGRGGCAILLNKLHRESSTGSNSSTTPKSKSSKAHAGSTSGSGSRVPEGVSSFGNKIWGLRMVDMRLLMTIAIRDSIFGYVGRCFEYFEYDVLEGLKPKNLILDSGKECSTPDKMSSKEDMVDSEQRSSSSSILDHFASTYASQGSSSSSGDDVKCRDKVDENPFEFDPLKQRAVPTPTPTPTLTPVTSLAGSTPFKPLSRSTYSSSSALLQSEKKDDKSLVKRSTRDGDAKATVTDFLPHQPITSESEKTKAGRDEKRAEKGREKARGRSKSDCTALSTSFKLSKLGQEKGRLGAGAALGTSSDTPPFSTDSIDGTPTKRKRIKLAELAARGFDSSQLLDFGASAAFGKLQRKQDGSQLLPQSEREFDADKEREKEKEKEKEKEREREREREKAKKKDQNVLVDSDLAELLMRPARLSESSLPRGDRDREKDRDKLRRKRAGTVGSGGRIDGKTVWDPSKHPYPSEDGDSSKNVPAFPASTGTSTGTSNSSTGKDSANSTSANTAANRQHGAPSTDNLKGQSTSLRYFMLELVDPQLNFLDTKSHSSLIMVAGRSSLEGQRETTAVLVPAAGSGGRPPHFPKVKRPLGAREKEISMEPKRQNEIKLHMDKVSAFTVPTLNITGSANLPGDAVNLLDEEDTDIVHWKAMDCTVEKVGDRVAFNKGNRGDSAAPGGGTGTGTDSDWSNNEDSSGGKNSERAGKPSYGYPSMLRERSRDVSRRFSRLHLEMLKESPSLRVAVKDFEVRARYTFWMDVTVKEANKMYVHRDRVSKDLVCSFLLDLPELCLDITSSQFYIGINVIKNVLLAQPPAMAASIRDNMNSGDGMEDGGGEQTSSKITEIFRDTLHTPLDLKAAQELNLKNRQSREEVKTLIEDYFNRVIEVKYGMARVVDLFIGKGTWILRSSPTAASSPNQSQEKVPTLSPSYLSGLGMGRLHGQSGIKTSIDRDKEKEKEKDAGELLETGFTGVHATFTYNEDRSSAVLFEVQRFWARNMNPMVHTGNSNSNCNSNSASNSNSNSTSNIYANNSNNNNSNSNSNSNTSRNVNSTAADTEGVASRRPDSREKGLRARAGKILSRSMPSFKRKEASTASSASEATSSDAEGTAAPALTPVSAPAQSMSPSMSAGPLDPTSDASSVQLRELSYSDAMTALGRREKERLQDKSWVLIPALAETEPCRRCGQLFDADDNDSNACAFHADRDGKLGEYRRVAVRNGTGGSQRLTLVKMWTCCHRTEENCPGCFSRPHICKDVMVSVRALGAPTMRIENIEMSVLRALEISIFPGAMTSWLQVRITRQLADVLHNYFSIDAVSNSEVQDPSAGSIVNSREKAVEGLNSTASSNTGSSLASGEVEKKQTTRDRVMTYLSYSKTAPDRAEGGGADKFLKMKSKEKEGSSKDKDVKTDRQRDTGAAVIYSGTSSGGRQEGLYIRYLRVGDIQVDVSLSGFPLNVENYRAVVEPFFCRGEVLQNWQRLIYSFERHASRSLIRNTASSSLTRLSNFFSFSGAPRSDGVTTTGDKIVEVIKRTAGTKSSAPSTQPDPDEEKKRKIALLLGGSSA